VLPDGSLKSYSRASDPDVFEGVAVGLGCLGPISQITVELTPRFNVVQVRKRAGLFLRHLYIKCIILPRQARDKHRESTQKKMTFRMRRALRGAVWGGGGGSGGSGISRARAAGHDGPVGGRDSRGVREIDKVLWLVQRGARNAVKRRINTLTNRPRAHTALPRRAVSVAAVCHCVSSCCSSCAVSGPLLLDFNIESHAFDRQITILVL